MDARQPETQKVPGTAGNKSANPASMRACRGFDADGCREHAGNIVGTAGNKSEQKEEVCSHCSRHFQLPGTAGGRAVTGCSHCSHCSRQKQQCRHAEFAPVKLLKAARRLACSLFFGAQKWCATLHRRTRSTSLQAAPFLGCSGLRCARAQFAQCAHMHRVQGWKPRGAWAADEFAVCARRPPRGVKGCESARLRALTGEGVQPCASA